VSRIEDLVVIMKTHYPEEFLYAQHASESRCAGIAPLCGLQGQGNAQESAADAAPTLAKRARHPFLTPPSHTGTVSTCRGQAKPQPRPGGRVYIE